MVQLSSKPVILEIDSVRVIRFNNINLAVERLEDVYIRIKKVTEKRWVFHGYSDTILSALRLISRKELLIDETSISGINDYVKRIEESNARLLEEMRE